jgi:hypothetical protein
MDKLGVTVVSTLWLAMAGGAGGAGGCGAAESTASDSAAVAPPPATLPGAHTNGAAGSGSTLIAMSMPVTPMRTAAPLPTSTANPAVPAPGAAVPMTGGAQVPPATPTTTPPPPVMTTPMMQTPATPPPRVPGQGTCLQGSGGYDKDGPYGAALTMDVELSGLGPYTIFYPANLEAECKHPIVSWGNGTGVTGSATYSAYHRRAASWGIVTIASHNENAGSMKFIEGGIDYLLAENAKPGSPFEGKLSDRAGVSGHSQGGIAATTAATHPKVQAEVCVQGGGFGVPASVAFMCQTGVDDFLRGMCTGTYNSAAGPSFLLDHQMADHISTPTFGLSTSEPGMQYVRTATAWFRCWLADDETACALFQGNTSAPVCGESMWATCSSRNL